MSEISITSPELPGLKIKQKRSQKTYDALIRTAFRLLKKRGLSSISIAELTQAAGYSVGAFYARFQSKDEFLDALVEHHVKSRRATHDYLFSRYQGDELIDRMIEDVVSYIWKISGFYRSSLERSVYDQDFWKPMRSLGHELANFFISSLSSQINRALTETEEFNIRFAFQITFGTVNNAIINRPGPIQIEQKLFTEQLTRAFRLVSDYDNIVSRPAQTTRADPPETPPPLEN